MDELVKRILTEGVRAAGQRIMQYKGQFNSFTKTEDYDYGIPADKEAEKIILDSIKKSGINCRIISEESGKLGNEDPEYKIYLDAIDGSVNFSRGIPVFCIGLAVYFRDKPELGIIYDPSQDELFVAEKGKGISINGKKIEMPETQQDKILVNLEWFGAEQYAEIVSKLKEAKIRARSAGSGVLALCYSCIGRGDAAILIDNSPWDVAPGMVFAVEAGYKIKQIDGKDVDLEKRKINVIAASAGLFEAIFNIIKNP